MTAQSPFHVSAGGVVLRRLSPEGEVCLIRRSRYQRETWCLPKGHLEAGEDAARAAAREVEEETGIKAKIVEPLEVITYQFSEPAQRSIVHRKQVTFFLMLAENDRISPHDTTEVMEARWMPLAEAIRMAAYDKEREVLRRAGVRLKQLLQAETHGSASTDSGSAAAPR